MSRLTRVCGFGALFVLSALAFGQDAPVDTFIGLPSGGTTTWGTSGNWSLGRPPTLQEDGSIVFGDTRDRTIVFDQSASGQQLSVVNSGGGQLTLIQNAGFNLNFGTEAFGVQVAGDNQLHTSNFVQTGGTNSAASINVGGINVYYGAGSYSISGGTLQTASLTVGEYNAGHFTQTGGSVLTDETSVADRYGSTGIYDLSAGTFHSTGRVYVGGDNGNGTFNQTGGLAQIDDRLVLGYSGANTAGTYSISSNAATLHAGSELLGDHATGNIVQSAGTNRVDGLLEVGHVYAGNYQMSGGTLSTATLAVSGINAVGTFSQTGGSVTVGSPTAPGQLTLVNRGTLSLSGSASSLTVNGLGLIGQDDFASSLLAQSGGTATFTGGLNVNHGEYRLSGGTLAAGSIAVAPGGSFNWSGGTIAAKSVSVDGTMTLSPGHNKTLAVQSFGVDYLASGSGGVNGRVDLADNSLVIDYTAAGLGSQLSVLRSELFAGALTSSTADAMRRIGYGDNAVLNKATFGDQTFAANHQTEVLAGYVYSGDCNLDGKVDVIDLGLLASHWQQSGYWTDGDLNYDGRVDVVDLGLLAGTWQDGTTGRASFADALASFDLSQTPEPNVLAAAAIALLFRRSRGR